MDHLIVYEGRLVALAALRREYAEAIALGINRDRAVHGTRQRGPYSLADAEKYFEAYEIRRGSDEVFAILKRTENGYELIGLTGIHSIRWPQGYGTTGSMIFKEEDRGKTGTEAKLLLCYHAFQVLGLRKLCSAVKAFNAPSLGHLVKCGFSVVGRWKQHDFHEGLYIDELVLELFKDEWLPIWTRYNENKELPSLTPEQKEFVQKETAI